MGASRIALVFGLLTVAIIVGMLRRRRMREKYATAWMAVSVVVVALAVRPELLSWASERLGVVVPVNLLYFLAALGALLVSVQFSVELSALEERSRVLAEEVALLRAELADHGHGPDGRGPGRQEPGAVGDD